MSLTKARILISKENLATFCDRWHIQEFALFGSVLRDDFHPDSDIDVLVTFNLDAKRGLLTQARIKHELEDKLGRKVDLVNKEAVKASPNWIRRQEILSTAQVIY
ncbi:MAG: nucleotidyltransferase family protein [Leptolyngbyaceae cyanobacterium]